MSHIGCPLTLRLVKGSRLTHAELDNNFISLKHCITSVADSDLYITGSTFDYSTYDLTLFRSDGNTIVQNLAGLADDIFVISGEYNPTNGVLDFTNISGGTFSVSGFTTGMTNYYTISANLSGKTLTFDRTDTSNAYTVDLSSLGETGSTLVPLIYNQSLAAPNNSVQPAFGTSTIDSGATFSNILGGNSTGILNNSSYSSILGGNGLKIRSDFSTILGGVKQDIFSGSTYALIGQGDGGVISNSKYSTILNGKGNKITPNPILGGAYGDDNNTIIGGYSNTISSYSPNSNRKSWNLIVGSYNKIDGYGYYTGNIIVGGGDNYSSTGSLIYAGNGRNTVIGGNGYGKINPKNLFGPSSKGYSYFSASTDYYSNIIIGGDNNAIFNGYGNTLIPNKNTNFRFSGPKKNTIIGGIYNNLVGRVENSFILRGRNNTISGGTIFGQYVNGVSIINGNFNSVIKSNRSLIAFGDNSSIYGVNDVLIFGSNNTVTNPTHNNSHIIGSNITSVSANTTHVNNLNIYDVPVTDNSLNDLLVRDTNGQVRVRQASSFTGGTSATTATLTTKFAITTGFTQDVTLTINHGFGLSAGEEYDIVVKLRDIDNNIEIDGVVDNFQSNDVDITLSQTYANVRVVIIA